MPTFHLAETSEQKKPIKLPALSVGSSGSTVRVLQQLLNFKGFSLEVDGEFNLPTQNAVKEFQQLNSLIADGIVDAKTWCYLSAGLLPVDC